MRNHILEMEKRTGRRHLELRRAYNSFAKLNAGAGGSRAKLVSMLDKMMEEAKTMPEDDLEMLEGVVTQYMGKKGLLRGGFLGWLEQQMKHISESLFGPQLTELPPEWLPPVQAEEEVSEDNTMGYLLLIAFLVHFVHKNVHIRGTRVDLGPRRRSSRRRSRT